MDLVSTIDLMKDGDFKGRLAAEYLQITIRADKLEAYMDKFPKSQVFVGVHAGDELMPHQLMTMLQYRAALRDRMEAIGINCEELDIMARG